MDNFTGNHTAAVTNESIDYYTSYESPSYAIIPSGTQDFLLEIEIVSDCILENNELFRIHAGNPDEDSCYTDVIIRDDDGKLLHYCEIHRNHTCILRVVCLNHKR